MQKCFFRILRGVFIVAVFAAAVFPWNGCKSGSSHRRSTAGRGEEMLVTGYCSCGKCCGWERSWFGLGGPVYSSGPNKGKPKKVGVTASGKKAHRGTVAADPRLFGFGTVLEIPGYGRGVVEDVGSAIKEKHIDVWFPSHEEALKWGRRRVRVKVVKKK